MNQPKGEDMKSKFITCDRDTLYVMPPSVDDWLPKDHIARFIVEILEQLDVSEIEAAYSSKGRSAYPVRALLGLLFYGYITGVCSSRKIEQATYDSVPFRYIAANLHPDHDTIAYFRKRFLKELDGIFLQILLIASEMKILKLGNVSTDGSKLLANASKHKALSWEYANKLEAQLKEELKQLHKMAEEADNIPEEMNIPEELARREARLQAIQSAKQEIDKRAQERYTAEEAEYDEKIKQRKTYETQTGKKKAGKSPKAPIRNPKKRDQVNLTDKESRIMPKSGGGFVQAFNAQMSVDVKSYLIVANHVTQSTNDKREIVPTVNELKKTEAVLGQKVSCILADAGYFSESNVKYCAKSNIAPLIVDKRDKHNKSLTSRFEHADGEAPEDTDPVVKMKHRLQTKEGKELYAQRKSTVEPVFGIIKNVMKFRQFSLRGHEAASGEWNLVAIAWNLKRMFTLSRNLNAQNMPECSQVDEYVIRFA